MNKQQQPEKKVRFYHTKGFRGLIAVALAVILLGSGAIDNISSLFATDEGVLDAFEEAPMPAPQPEPTSQPAAEQGSGDRDQGIEEKGETESASEQPDEEGFVEEEEEPAEPDSTDEPTANPGNPLAQVIAARGMAYVRVDGDVFSSAALRERDRLGRVGGIAIAARYNEPKDEEPATVKIALATADALVEGYVNAASVMLLDYEATIAEIGEDAVREYTSPAWPLPAAGFDPAEAAATKSEAEKPTDVLQVEPVITLFVSIEGDKVILTAQIEGIPEGVAYTLQWQNDMSGEFADVPGETGESVAFGMDSENVRYQWRVALHTMDAGEGNAGDQ